MMFACASAALCLALLSGSSSLVARAAGVQPAAEAAVFLVRHAERADTAGGAAPMMGSDPDLSAAGRDRAAALALVLKNAGITAIYVTEYKRTRQTAEPLAKALGVEPVVVPARDSAALVAKLTGATGNVLVIGHSNTLPPIVKSLGVAEEVTIGDSDYDDLLVVTRRGTPQLLRLKYR